MCGSDGYRNFCDRCGSYRYRRFGQEGKKFSYNPTTIAAQGYKFVKYVSFSKDANIFLAKCVPGGEVVSIEQVPLCREALNRSFWKWIRHPNILRLLHYFSDDCYAYFVRRDRLLTTVYDTLVAGPLALQDCESVVSLHRQKCLQKWSRQILCAIDYLNGEGFHHNGFSWNAAFLDDGDAYLGGFEHLVHFTDKNEFELGDLRYCPPEALKSGVIKRDEIAATESWRFGAHLLEGLTCKLISGSLMQPFSDEKNLNLSRKVLLQNVKDNLCTLPKYMSMTGLPETLQSTLLGLLHADPDTRLRIKTALSEVEWLNEGCSAVRQEESVAKPCKANAKTKAPRPQKLESVANIKKAPDNWWRVDGCAVKCKKNRLCEEPTSPGVIQYLLCESQQPVPTTSIATLTSSIGLPCPEEPLWQWSPSYWRNGAPPYVVDRERKAPTKPSGSKSYRSGRMICGLPPVTAGQSTVPTHRKKSCAIPVLTITDRSNPSSTYRRPSYYGPPGRPAIDRFHSPDQQLSLGVKGNPTDPRGHHIRNSKKF